MKIFRDEEEKDDGSARKYQRIEEGGGAVDPAIISTTSNESVHVCSCGRPSNNDEIFVWFRDNPASNEYSCPDCDAKLDIYEFLLYKNAGEGGADSCNDFGLKTFIALKLPVKSIDLSEDQATGIIESERNGAPFIFRSYLEAGGMQEFIQTTLIYAAEMEHLSLIEYISKTHYDLCFDNSYRFSICLQHAIGKSVVNSVKLLFDFRKELGLEHHLMDVLMERASEANSAKIYEMLLLSNSNYLFDTAVIKKLFYAAAEKGNGKILSVLIQRTEFPDNFIAENLTIDQNTLKSLIFKLLVENNVQGMKNFLLLKIPFPSLADKGIYSILEVAAAESLEMFLLLLNSGISFAGDKTLSMICCFLRAIERNNQKVIDYLKIDINAANENGFTVLHLAIRMGVLNVIKKILELGADVNFDKNNSTRPLALAISTDKKEIVTFLLKAGACLNDSDQKRESSLYLALKNGNFEYFKALEDHYGFCSLYFPDGSNYLHHAIFYRQIHVVKYLLKQGITPMTKNGHVSWCLSKLMTTENTELLEFLIEKCGANVYEEEIFEKSSNLTTLMIAIYFNQIKNIEIFLRNGYNPNRSIESGTSTLLHYACIKGKFEIAKILIKYGADTNALDRFGWTPFKYVKDPNVLEDLKNMNEFI